MRTAQPLFLNCPLASTVKPGQTLPPEATDSVTVNFSWFIVALVLSIFTHGGREVEMLGPEGLFS